MTAVMNTSVKILDVLTTVWFTRLVTSSLTITKSALIAIAKLTDLSLVLHEHVLLTFQSAQADGSQLLIGMLMDAALLMSATATAMVMLESVSVLLTLMNTLTKMLARPSSSPETSLETSKFLCTETTLQLLSL